MSATTDAGGSAGRMAWLVLAAIVLVSGTAAGQEQGPPSFADRLPRIPARSPAEAAATFTVEPGFRVDLAASEPEVVDPVALDWDARGRLFVCEMRDYSEQETERLGRVRLLEDRNGDGHYEHAQVYLEGLSWPTGLLCYDGGLFVAAAPDLWYVKDTNGDGRADEQTKVLTGFGRTNVQGLVNCLRWTLDNRIELAVSSCGGNIRCLLSDTPEKAVRVNGRDLSFDPRQPTSIRLETGGGQHGMAFDDWGRKFVSSNSDHLQLIIGEQRLLGRNPHLPVPNPRLSIAADGPQAEVYRTSPVEPWRIVRTELRVAGSVPGPVEGGGRAAGYFTGATGATIYRGDAWPEAYRGRAFIADVGSNLIHQKELTPAGVGLRGQRVTPEREFLTSSDIWFRPVQMANAPDGTLWALDMSREVIEHPKSLPPAIKRHLDLTSGRDQGRLWRITPTDYQHRPTPDLTTYELAELVSLLEHPNAWHRETAARLIYQRQDPAAAEPLRPLAKTSDEPLGRMHALYALQGLGLLDSNTLTGALADSHPRVRQHAARLIEQQIAATPELTDGFLPHLLSATRAELARPTEQADLPLRFQLACTLGACSAAEAAAALAELATSEPRDPWLRVAVLGGLAGRGHELLAALWAGESHDKATVDLVSQLAELAAREGPAARAAVVSQLQTHPTQDQLLETAVLTGFLAADRKPVLTAWMAGDDRELAAWAKSFLATAQHDCVNDKLPAGQRMAAVTRLALGDFATAAPALEELLAPAQSQMLQQASLAALDEFAEPRVAEIVLAAWPQFSPALRQQAVRVLLARRERLDELLAAVKEGAIAAVEIDPATVQVLRSHRDENVRAQATELFGSTAAGDRTEVVQQYQAALTLPGDPARGREHFQKVCAACHKVGDLGQELGPNLAAFRSRGREALLVNVFDPNREVNPQYLNYAVLTTDGRSFTGMITAETATSITLSRGENQTATLLRSEIDELRSTGQSLMPEGLEKQVSPQQMADLLAFVFADTPPPKADEKDDEAAEKNAAAAGPVHWQVGLARRKITPEGSVWLSGYAGRKAPATGTASDLYAKALWLEDAQGNPAVLITTDLIGVKREFTHRVCERLIKAHGLDRAQIALSTSHTHCGPIVGTNLQAMYFLDEVQQQKIIDYTARLENDLVELVSEAKQAKQPARLAWSSGRCTFAVNRRNNAEPQVPALRQAGQLVGPVDHDVPVLTVRSVADDHLLGVVFGYACHATTMSFLEYCADWPGYAQTAVEEEFPGTVAMFWAGCGGDQNPLPRRKLELAQQYGRQLAAAVAEEVRGTLQPIRPRLLTRYEEVELPFANVPSRQQLEADTQNNNRYIAKRAELLLEQLEQAGQISKAYPYPVQLWKLGEEVDFLILGGEVVVDYALLLKAGSRGRATWVAAYSNDVMAYIPSRRVLQEGGYEGDTSMIYYGLPSVWSPEVEPLIQHSVRRVLEPATTAGATP